jgi:hypothetical protein
MIIPKKSIKIKKFLVKFGIIKKGAKRSKKEHTI